MALLVCGKSSGFFGDRTIALDGIKAKIESSAQEVYVVIADSDKQSADQILASAGIPKVGQRFGFKNVVNVSASAVAPIKYRGTETMLWEVTVKFESIDITDEDPLDLDPEISWSSETYEEVLTQDYRGRAVETACGEPILITVPRACPVATITKYKPETFLIPASAVGCINEETFMGWRPYSALLKNISFAYEKKTIREEEFTFAKVTYTIVFKDDGSEKPWAVKVLHQGRKCKDRNSGEVRFWQDKEGNTGMVNLTEEGYAIEGAVGEPYFLEFDIYKAVDFSLLGL